MGFYKRDLIIAKFREDQSKKPPCICCPKLDFHITDSQVPENWCNLDRFLELTKVREVNFKLAGDLKVFNLIQVTDDWLRGLKVIPVLQGLSTHSGRHPCCFCEASYIKGVWEEQEKVVLRTYATDKAHYDEFCRAGAIKNDAKLFKNCGERPLLGQDQPHLLYMLLMPPPQLHLFLSLNHLLEALDRRWPGLAQWLADRHVVFAPYHGVTLEVGLVQWLVQWLLKWLVQWLVKWLVKCLVQWLVH